MPVVTPSSSGRTDVYHLVTVLHSRGLSDRPGIASGSRAIALTSLLARDAADTPHSVTGPLPIFLRVCSPVSSA